MKADEGLRDAADGREAKVKVTVSLHLHCHGELLQSAPGELMPFCHTGSVEIVVVHAGTATAELIQMDSPLQPVYAYFGTPQSHWHELASDARCYAEPRLQDGLSRVQE